MCAILSRSTYILSCWSCQAIKQLKPCLSLCHSSRRVSAVLLTYLNRCRHHSRRNREQIPNTSAAAESLTPKKQKTSHGCFDLLLFPGPLLDFRRPFDLMVPLSLSRSPGDKRNEKTPAQCTKNWGFSRVRELFLAGGGSFWPPVCPRGFFSLCTTTCCTCWTKMVSVDIFVRAARFAAFQQGRAHAELAVCFDILSLPPYFERSARAYGLRLLVGRLVALLFQRSRGVDVSQSLASFKCDPCVASSRAKMVKCRCTVVCSDQNRRWHRLLLLGAPFLEQCSTVASPRLLFTCYPPRGVV